MAAAAEEAEEEEGEALPEAIEWMEWKREKGASRNDVIKIVQLFDPLHDSPTQS